MRVRSSAVNLLIVSFILIIAALVLAVVGIGIRFNFGAGASFTFGPLLWAILAAVVCSFLLGWVRYDLAGGVSLAFAAAHDQIVALSATAILSLLFPQASVLPALQVAGLAFTYVFTIPVLREARLIARATPLKDLVREDAADKAVHNTQAVRLLTLIASGLLLLAFLVSGNMRMLGAMLPLVLALAAAVVSSSSITPYVWAAIRPKRKARR
jgi:preprotein translocase subunit SecF